MDFLREVVRLVLLLLLFYTVGDCYSVKCSGNLTLDKDIIPMGSNLTVHCQSNTVQCNRLFSIELSDQTILQKISCSNVTTQLMVKKPEFRLYCWVEHEQIRQLVCGRDIVADFIPDTPHIKEIVFSKGSLSATIFWESSDNVELLNPSLRFRRTFGSPGWMEGNVTQLQRGRLLMMEDLEPLTLYQFEIRVCTSILLYNCSLWSRMVSLSSPGQAPFKQLDVWRVVRIQRSDTQNVTVLWKAFTSEDFKGDLLGYELVYEEKGTTHTLNCSAAASQYTLQLPLEVTNVNISAVTSAGNSPPAPVRLISTEYPAPRVYSSQTAEHRIQLAWNWSHHSYTIPPEQTLGFIIEWQCSSLQVQWKRIAKDQNSAIIDGTPPCTGNFSLYVESIKGISHPASGPIYLKDQKTSTNSRPGVDKQYSTKNLIIHSAVPAPVRATQWPEEGVIIGICLMIAVPIIIIMNLLYMKCARQRIRKTCLSVGPSWFFENLPQLGNSNAIKLLQDDKCGSDICWQPVDSDPPLSPVEDFNTSTEVNDSYPIAHTEDSTKQGVAVQDWTTCPYKPQISIVSQRTEAFSEAAENEEDPWLVFSPAFNDEVFFPSQGIDGPLKSCLTVDGTPVSMDFIDGLIFLTHTDLDKNIWGEAQEIGNEDDNSYQRQTVLPNNFIKCLREPSFNVRSHSPQGSRRVLHTPTALHGLEVTEQFL
ncbi:interleukin-23 receptor [Hoplias malabaricus]|uniref:interleukin-23 receptor n=1 Tax=Hoplias malabaricus TaxID=27720 RepID=UPI003461A323